MGVKEKVAKGMVFVVDESKELASKGVDKAKELAKEKLDEAKKIDWRKIRIERLTRACKELFAKAESRCTDLMAGIEVGLFIILYK